MMIKEGRERPPQGDGEIDGMVECVAFEGNNIVMKVNTLKKRPPAEASGLLNIQISRLGCFADLVFFLGFAEFNRGLSSSQAGYRYTERRARHIV